MQLTFMLAREDCLCLRSSRCERTDDSPTDFVLYLYSDSVGGSPAFPKNGRSGQCAKISLHTVLAGISTGIVLTWSSLSLLCAVSYSKLLATLTFFFSRLPSPFLPPPSPPLLRLLYFPIFMWLSFG